MLLVVSLIIFFAITALKDFGVAFKYWDLLRGLAGCLIVLALLLGNRVL